jgi:hypothetical protein
MNKTKCVPLMVSIALADTNNVFTNAGVTLPKLTPDGHTIKEMFKFGSDRKTIGPFVRAS